MQNDQDLNFSYLIAAIWDLGASKQHKMNRIGIILHLSTLD